MSLSGAQVPDVSAAPSGSDVSAAPSGSDVSAAPSGSDVSAAPSGSAAPAPAIGIGRAALLGMIGSGAGMVFTILRSKVTAVALGPDGIGKAAEILQLVTLGNLAATTITGPALIGSLAEARGRGDHAAIARLVRAATTLVLIVSGVGGLLAVLSGFFILPAPWGPRAFPLTLLAALAALLTSWALIPQQVLAAHLEIKQQTALRLLIAGIGTALTCAATLLLGLTGQFVAAAIAAAIALPLSFRVARARAPVPATPARAVDRAFLLRALTIGGSGLVVGYAMQGTLLVTRGALERHGGPGENGQFQAAWAIGTTYIAMLLDGAGSYTLPRYAAAATPEALSAEMRLAERFVLQTMIPVLFAAIVLRGLLVRALYDHRFDEAIELVGLQLAGDVCKVVSWVNVGPLLYRNQPRAFLAVELPTTLALGLLALLLIPRHGVIGFGYAYIAVNAAYVAFSGIAVARSCGVPLDGRRVGLALLGAAAAVLVIHLDRASPVTRWVVLALCAAYWYRTGVLARIAARLRGKLAPILGRAPGHAPARPDHEGDDADSGSARAGRHR